MSIKLINKASRVLVFASNPKNIMAIPNKEIEITEEQYNVLKQLNTFENYVNKGEMQVKFDAPVFELEKKTVEPVKVVEEAVEVEAVEEKPKRRGRKKKG